ncbi:ataxin 1 [Haematobia irritans]|uniref:ataxin 1 n=1 Tax=Haematobia irritans TaxID=7368 RepID=UPI003F4FA4A4
MSPVSIPAHQRKLIHSDQQAIIGSTVPSHHQQLPQTHAMELTTASVPSGFPLNYQQLYANNAAIYGTPVMFSGAIHAAHASYMAGLPMHAALSPNDNYLKAIQAAACGIYSPTALAPPLNPANLMSCKATSIHNSTGPLMALAPSTPIAIPSKSPQYLPSNDMINKSEVEQTVQDYHASSPLNAIASTRLSQGGSGTGTYLNDKVSDNNNDASNDSHFKVPNGKEGSLKHRILRPPSSDGLETSKTPVMRAYTTTSNFKKGTYIELANGSLRRVEDMRTEDFIQCAERSPQHQLAESTVVKINTSQSTMAVITFSYDRNRSKVDMEVSVDHPFFVYGQGWASCNPETSMQVFGLKCQRLQVGDICISLTKRTSSSISNGSETTNSQRRHSLSSITSQSANINSPSTQPNAMNSTADIPYPHAFAMPVHTNLPHHLPAYAEMAKLMSSYAYAKGLPQISHEQLKAVNAAFYQSQIYQQQQQQHHHHQQQDLLRRHELKYNQERTPPLISNPGVDPDLLAQTSQTHPLDASISRKRRWSAPENMFDDDDADTQPPRNPPIPASSKALSPSTTAHV